MLTRRTMLATGAALAPAVLRSALGADKTVKIGNTMPYSGPASAYSSIGKADAGFFEWVNDLKTPLIYQTGPKTSAKRGCSCSIWEKRCINGRSQSSRMVGMRS